MVPALEREQTAYSSLLWRPHAVRAGPQPVQARLIRCSLALACVAPACDLAHPHARNDVAARVKLLRHCWGDNVPGREPGAAAIATSGMML